MQNLHKNYVKEKLNASGILTEYKTFAPDNFNFAFDVIDQIAKEQPGKLAMLWCNDIGEERRFSFHDFSILSNQCANFLKSQGIKKGDKVMLVLKRHFEFWIAILALCKIGAVVIPATHLLTAKDYEYRFNAAGVKMIICTVDNDSPTHVEAALQNSPTVKKLVLVRGQKRDGWINFNQAIEKESDIYPRSKGSDANLSTDPMLMFFTSGTTGFPKMVLHNYSYPLGHIHTAKYWHNVQENGLHLTVADTGWAKSAWGKIYGQWFMEAALFVYDYDKFIPTELLQVISKYKITTFCAPPTIYRFFIKEDLEKYDLSLIKSATIAGEALNPEVYNKFFEKTGIKVLEGFGQTETTVLIYNQAGTNPKPGSMGKPSPQYDIDLVDENCQTVKDGEVGEIIIRTKNGKPNGLFCEYYLDENKTNSVWYDDAYHTGDTAWRDEDGFYWFIGRKDDLIKSSGYRIGPFEVESVIMEHPAVLECAVIGIPDEVRGQAVKAAIVLAKGYKNSKELMVEIQNYVKTHTAPYKYPRVVEFVEELPKTTSGKIRRNAIRNS